MRRIFELAAEGVGHHAIAKQLNAEGVLTPRPTGASARVGAVVGPRGVHRPRYSGDLVWNRTSKCDRWGQHQRTIVTRGPSGYVSCADLRIVPDDLWQAAHAAYRGVRSRDEHCAASRDRRCRNICCPAWRAARGATAVCTCGTRTRSGAGCTFTRARATSTEARPCAAISSVPRWRPVDDKCSGGIGRRSYAAISRTRWSPRASGVRAPSRAAADPRAARAPSSRASTRQARAPDGRDRDGRPGADALCDDSRRSSDAAGAPGRTRHDAREPTQPRCRLAPVSNVTRGACWQSDWRALPSPGTPRTRVSSCASCSRRRCVSRRFSRSTGGVIGLTAPCQLGGIFGSDLAVRSVASPGRIRTAGLALRRRALYPSELRGRDVANKLVYLMDAPTTQPARCKEARLNGPSRRPRQTRVNRHSDGSIPCSSRCPTIGLRADFPMFLLCALPPAIRGQRIENPSCTVTPELVLRGRRYRCTGVARSLCHRVHIG